MKHLLFFISLLFVSFSSFAKEEKILISEVFYDSPLYEYKRGNGHQGGEFVELYNAEDNPVDISGWILQGGDCKWERYIFPAGTVMQSGEFILIETLPKNERSQLSLIFPDMPKGRIFYQDRFILNNYGDLVRLYNSKEKIVDELYYANKKSLLAENGYVRTLNSNAKYLSIQRDIIRGSWEHKFDSNDYIVDYATPFSNSYFSSLEDLDWKESASDVTVEELFGSTMNGSSGVSPSGAALYTIPIALPQGGSKVAPQLAISYNSQINDGILGHKWGLSGLSSIAVVNKSYYFDGKNNFNDNTYEALALDGVRLAVLSDGTYRLENDPYTVISANGTSGFKVRKPDGTVLTYASRVDAISENGQKPFAWDIVRQEDINGNYITYKYLQRGDENVLHRIEYGGNVKDNILPYYLLQFEYTHRNSGRAYYKSGNKITNNSLLSSISLFYKKSKIKEYGFGYNGDCLTSIKEMMDGASKVSSTTVNYHQSKIEVSNYSNTWKGQTPLFYGSFLNDGKEYGLILQNDKYVVTDLSGNTKFAVSGLPTKINQAKSRAADVNGDGLTDLLLVTGSNDDAGECKIYLSNGKSFVYNGSFPWNSGERAVYADGILVGDFDGSKVPQVVVAFRVKKEFNILGYSNTGKELFHKIVVIGSKNTPSIYSGDFNGDGIMDFAYYEKGIHIIHSFYQESLAIKGTYAISNKNLSTGDFNGDGITDFVDKLSNHQCAIYYSTGNGFTEKEIKTFKDKELRYNFKALPSTGILDATIYNKAQTDICFLDINGDGKTEILQLWSVYKPENYIFELTWKGMGGNSVSSVDVPAWDRFNRDVDAQMDKHLKEMQWVSVCDDTGYVLAKIDKGVLVKAIGDFKGQGTEQIIIEKEDKQSYTSFKGSSSNAVLVSSIVNNGTKTSTTFDYKILSNDNSYVRTPNLNGEVCDFVAPIYVVSSIGTSNAAGGIDKTTYTYEHLKFHRGKGLLGFTKVISSNKAKNRTIEQSYTLDSYYNMLPESVLSTTIDGDYISRESTGYLTRRSILPAKGYCYQIYPNQSVTEDYLDGNKTVTSYTYSDEGLLTGQSTVYGYNSDAKSSVTLQYATVAGVDKVIKRTEAFRYGQAEEVTASKEFKYDAGNGNLLTETLYPGKGKEIKKIYAYGKAGLPVSVTLKANGQPARTTRYEYDSDMRFVVKETDHLNHFVEKTYQPENGLLLSVKESLTGHTVTYEYDAFGRVKAIRDPFGKTQNILTDWASKAGGDAPVGAVSFVGMKTPNLPVQKEFYDVLGRKLRTVEERFDGKVYVDYKYDAAGQMVEQSLPYSEKESPLWSVMEYDDYGRVTSQSIGEQSVFYSYDSHEVTETKAGQSKTKRLDALGNVIEVEEGSGTIGYKYNSYKEISQIITPNGTTRLFYDSYGKKIGMYDPNAGNIDYQYDELGRLTSQIDANGNLIRFTYDNADRIRMKITPEDTVTYVYNDKELLESVISSNGTSQYYKYNDRGQIVSLKEIIKGNSYTTSYGYDAYGNNTVMIYPSGFMIRMDYASDGTMLSVKTKDGSPIWTLGDVDAQGKVTRYTNGDDLQTVLDVDKYGRVGSIVTDGVQHLSYEYDSQTGNLLKRKDLRKGLTEAFEYDSSNQLTSYQVEGQEAFLINYSVTGNIRNKSDLGTYEYGEAQKNAVKRITLQNNSVLLPQQDVTYTSFNKISSIRVDNLREEFIYGVDEQRRMVNTYKGADLIRSVVYSVNYEKITEGGRVTERNYISTPSGVTAVYTKQDGVSRLYYLCKDHQSSITALVDEEGNIREEYAYDAWGRRRNPQDWTYNNVPAPQLMSRGYTMHEHMDAFGLINMNGRIYDPCIARILSPDILVSDPFSLLDYNRYTYCHNNPLMYVDPDGNCAWVGWVAAGIISIGKFYQDGRKANHGEKNPVKWDWGRANFTIGAGSVGSGFNAYAGVGWNNNYGFAFGYNGQDVTIGYLNNGNPVLAPLRDRVSEGWERISTRQNWDFSAYSKASASLIVLADDFTGVGVFDDWIVPATFGVATVAFLYDNESLLLKRDREIDHLLSRENKGPQGFTYELVAKSNGQYKNVRGGTTFLRVGEVWKYGETTQGEYRYSKRSYEAENFTMHPIFFGNQVEIKNYEKIMIYGYVFDRGVLPPGNSIFR